MPKKKAMAAYCHYLLRCNKNKKKKVMIVITIAFFLVTEKMKKAMAVTKPKKEGREFTFKLLLWPISSGFCFKRSQALMMVGPPSSVHEL